MNTQEMIKFMKEELRRFTNEAIFLDGFENSVTQLKMDGDLYTATLLKVFADICFEIGYDQGSEENG